MEKYVYFMEGRLGRRENGISLIELMIIVILISVIATAFLNSRLHISLPAEERPKAAVLDDSIRSALDEISYHLRFAGYASPAEARPVSIEYGERADRIMILHNGARFEYFLDNAGNLMRKVGETQEILASKITSLKVLVTGKETIVVTISTDSGARQETNGSKMLSRSFSTAVATNNLS
jgi:hypothetical protein